MPKPSLAILSVLAGEKRGVDRGAPAWGDPHGAACAITAKRRYRSDTTPGTFDRQRAYARHMCRITVEPAEIVDPTSPATPDPALRLPEYIHTQPHRNSAHRSLDGACARARPGA